MTDPLIYLNDKIEGTRKTLGVRNRQPQGQLVPFPIAGSGVFDQDDAWDLYIRIPERIYVLIEVVAEFYFKEFSAPARSASSGGSSAPTTTSGGSSSPTSSSATAHRHTMFNRSSGTPFGWALAQYHADGSNAVDLRAGNNTLVTYSADGSHDHTVTIGGHSHGVTIDPHAHDLEYGLHLEPMPGSIDVGLGLYRRTGSVWELITSVSGLNEQIEEVNLSQWLEGPGSWRITLESVPGQPNNGRLGVDVAGSILGAIKSA